MIRPEETSSYENSASANFEVFDLPELLNKTSTYCRPKAHKAQRRKLVRFDYYFLQLIFRFGVFVLAV